MFHSGFFGSVLKGELMDETEEKSTTVAVKTVQGEYYISRSCTFMPIFSIFEIWLFLQDATVIL